MTPEEPTVNDALKLVRRIRACEGEVAGVALVARWTRAAVAEEREACAHVADREASELDQWGEHAAGTAKSIAAAIRARP